MLSPLPVTEPGMAMDFFMKRYDESGVEDEIGFTKFLPLVLNDIVIAGECLS